MKRFFITTAVAALFIFLVCPLAACSRKPDYFSFVSEYRSEVYYYKDDELELKIFGANKETPCNLDGIKGNMNEITEIYFKANRTPSEVHVDVAGRGGDMNYLSVSDTFYLSFSGLPTGASLPVTLNVDGKERQIDVGSVATEGVIDGKTALSCVFEYDPATFEHLTEGKNFSGEIIVRLIYDDGCFYYVGVCAGKDDVHAFLLNAADGRIIAEKQGAA